MGDNITPPQQAFNWVADVYGSTEEIKARGQTIVGLLHEDIGHLGIFVSGRVAKKEHASSAGPFPISTLGCSGSAQPRSSSSRSASRQARSSRSAGSRAWSRSW